MCTDNNYKTRPVYVNDNPFKGTYKRNHEGDYHAKEYEVRAMIRDQNPDGNDGLILEHYTLDDIDMETFRHYRTLFMNRNPDHVWNSDENRAFLENLGGYRRDRHSKKEGLTLAGLLMFGKGLAIRDEFDNIFMDFRDESMVDDDVRWNDRITYDGTWENNLFNFFMKAVPKLTADIKKPFKLEGIQRIDETPVHTAIREAFVNMIIHADYLSEGTLKVIKRTGGLELSNPGNLKLPVEEIYHGGNSKPRNPKMQTMLRMIGFGDNAGSGFPKILTAWKDMGWKNPTICEDTVLNMVVLHMPFENKQKPVAQGQEKGQETREEILLSLFAQEPEISIKKAAEKMGFSEKQIRGSKDKLVEAGYVVRTGSDTDGKWEVTETGKEYLQCE